MESPTPVLAADIPTLFGAGLMEPFLEPIAIAAMLDPVDDDSILKSIPAHPPLLAPAHQVARDANAVASTQVDWCETPIAHIIKVDLPGVKKEEIMVRIVEGSTLEICGERKKEEVQKPFKWHLVERASGGFLRRFLLPENANLEDVKARVESGILIITISKRHNPEPHVVWIAVT